MSAEVMHDAEIITFAALSGNVRTISQLIECINGPYISEEGTKTNKNIRLDASTRTLIEEG